jgi:ribosomal protein uS5
MLFFGFIIDVIIGVMFGVIIYVILGVILDVIIDVIIGVILDVILDVILGVIIDAIRGAIILAKLSIMPVRRGYWGNKIGAPHTVPCKITGKCGSVTVRLIPAPRGTGLVCAPVPKKLLTMAGIQDCWTCSRGSTGTLGNFGKYSSTSILIFFINTFIR